MLGDNISYADFAVYQAYSDDSITKTIPVSCSLHLYINCAYLLTDLPQETLPASIVKFKEAFEARPTLATYLKERK